MTPVPELHLDSLVPVPDHVVVGHVDEPVQRDAREAAFAEELLLEPVLVPHPQRTPAGVAELPDRVRSVAFVCDVQTHGPVALLPAALRHKGLSSRSGSPRKRHHLEFINSLLNTNTRDGKVHLSPMIDCHGGEIIVCTAGFSPDAALADGMLVRAMESLPERAKPLVHSNCAAEGFFGRIKVEAAHPRTLGRTHTRRSAHLG